MAITLDASLGSKTTVGGSSSATFTTTGTAASGSRVVVCCSYFIALATQPTCTIGGTSATADKFFSNGSDRIIIFSLVVAGGLASGSTITVTFPGSAGGTFLEVVSYLGTTSLDTTANNTGTTAAAWTTTAVTCALADSLYVGMAATDGTITSESSTPGVGNERFDLFDATDNQGAVMQDLIVSSVGSNAITGTWGTTTGLTTQTMALVVYKGTAAAAGIPDLTMAPAHR